MSVSLLSLFLAGWVAREAPSPVAHAAPPRPNIILVLTTSSTTGMTAPTPRSSPASRRG